MRGVQQSYTCPARASGEALVRFAAGPQRPLRSPLPMQSGVRKEQAFTPACYLAWSVHGHASQM